MIWVLLKWLRFDMGGCFPCWGSSNQAGKSEKEAANKEGGKESSILQSHQLGKVNSGEILSKFFFYSIYFLGF